ncbi:Shedu anti-phage system protein SduA domain-containing protein [Nocardia araoensis]|uniref:Shedu anti-phage system protein SduA domain-containing protein n=1 Tax=Nocardia araoensis TaxID=228600 RepID=UPI000A05AD25|nr:Shedu anti-phage system protein SduA domain-containing protein [Nocardia araoensis]
MDEETYQAHYRREVLAYDNQLRRHGFTRLCNYRRSLTASDVTSFEEVLDSASNEHPLQAFLAERPHLLVNAHLAHGCRWVKAQPRLGAQYVPDFMVARMNSGGLEWTLIELQSPRGGLFLANNQPGSQLREGIDQVSRWRGLLTRWGTAVATSEGYPALSPDFRGIVLIGRSGDKLQDLAGLQRVQDLQYSNGLQIWSYDSIARSTRQSLRYRNTKPDDDDSVDDCLIDHRAEQTQTPSHP